MEGGMEEEENRGPEFCGKVRLLNKFFSVGLVRVFTMQMRAVDSERLLDVNTEPFLFLGNAE